MFPFAQAPVLEGGEPGLERSSGPRVWTAVRVLLPLVVELSFSRWWLGRWPGQRQAGLINQASPVVLGQFRAGIDSPR